MQHSGTSRPPPHNFPWSIDRSPSSHRFYLFDSLINLLSVYWCTVGE